MAIVPNRAETHYEEVVMLTWLGPDPPEFYRAWAQRLFWMSLFATIVVYLLNQSIIVVMDNAPVRLQKYAKMSDPEDTLPVDSKQITVSRREDVPGRALMLTLRMLVPIYGPTGFIILLYLWSVRPYRIKEDSDLPAEPEQKYFEV